MAGNFVFDILQGVLRWVAPRINNPHRDVRRNQRAPDGRNAFNNFDGNVDEFVNRNGNRDLLNAFPDTSKAPGGLSGIIALLKLVLGVYSSTVGNSNPTARKGIAEWAMNVLTQLAFYIERLLGNAVIKKSPLRGLAETLNASIKAALGFVKGFVEEQKQFAQSNKELGGAFTKDVSKMA